MKLTEMVDRLKREVDMLQSLKVQEQKRKTWFGKAAVPDASASPVAKNDADKEVTGRKWGSTAVVAPTTPKHIVQAHRAEAACVRWVGVKSARSLICCFNFI